MNVLDLVRKHGIDPKRVSSAKGGEYASPCPGCGGEDRFRIWPDQDDRDGTWWCRQCDKGGDGIQFLREYESMSYHEACAALGKDVGDYEAAPRRPFQPPDRPHRQAWAPTAYANPADLWREKAAKLVDWAHDYLTGDHGGPYMAWLSDRGIDPETVIRYRIGWNPGENGKDLFRPRESWGLATEIKENGRKKKLWLPRGLIIPFFIDDELQRIRIRRWENDGPRYYVVPGSCMAPMLIGENRRGYVVIETELDGMLLDQEVGDVAGVLALGSSSAKPDARAHRSMATALCILNALDFDQAGAKAWKWWHENYDRSERWPVPTGKDPGEAFQAGVDLRAWVIAGLPPGLTIGRSSSGLGFSGGKAFSTMTDAEGVAGPKKTNPAEGAAESVVELFGLLKQHPVKIRDGYTLLEHPDWARENWQTSKRISDLVFRDPDVRAHLDAHSALIVSGKNFWI